MTFTHTPKPDSRHTATRLLLSIMVCALLLQTPLPVAHQHSEYGLSGELVIHLDRHHGGLTDPADEVHWHFMLPGERGSEDDEPEQNPPLDAGLCYLAAPATGASTAALGSIDFDVRNADWLPAAFVVGPTDVPRSLDFGPPRSSLRPPVRLCALLCVIRC